MNAECLTFQPLYMERIWGGRKLQTHFRREIPSKSPIGESWEIVDREDAQSVVSEAEFCGVSLHELWVGHRHDIFGDGYDYPRFPILVKILDASDVLSVQVHPPAHRTVEGLIEPKTELWYFVAADEGAGIYAGLKNGTNKEDFEKLWRAAVSLLTFIGSRPERTVLFLFRAAGSTRLVQAMSSLRFSRIATRPTASLIGTGSDWTESRGRSTSNNR